MSAHISLTVLNKLLKSYTCEACLSVFCFVSLSLIYSIIQEHDCII